MRNNSAVCFVLLILVCMTGCAHAAPSGGIRVCVKKTCYAVDVMRTDAERARGLMFRKGLDEGQGMFFVFEAEGIYPFWMENMSFPIDIVWIDRHKRVVYAAENVPPCSAEPCPVYTPPARAMYVLEIPAGDVMKNRIKTGDTVR